MAQLSAGPAQASLQGTTNIGRALAVVTSLFFMWAVALNLNDVLIPHLKKACDLTDFQSSLIQSAYFGAYFLAALPAGALLKRVGYGRGLVVGLCVCGIGALLFYPAAETRAYPFFLGALFIMACGATVLEVAANPYVSVLGPPDRSEYRLNVAQFFNSVGAFITPLIGKKFILSGIEKTQADLAAMAAPALEAYRRFEAAQVQTPYLVLGGVFLLLAGVVVAARLPEIAEAQDAAEPSVGGTNPFALLGRHRHLAAGVAAQFCYVGAQVGIASFMIRFSKAMLPGLPELDAADYLFYHLVGFALGRLTGTVLMRTIAPAKLLGWFGVAALALTVAAGFFGGMVAVLCLVAVGYFNSIMFPTIFALAIKGLGADTKPASSLLVMSIVGGAIVPAGMGLLSDAANIQMAMLLPAACYLAVAGFALSMRRAS